MIFYNSINFKTVFALSCKLITYVLESGFNDTNIQNIQHVLNDHEKYGCFFFVFLKSEFAPFLLYLLNHDDARPSNMLSTF